MLVLFSLCVQMNDDVKYATNWKSKGPWESHPLVPKKNPIQTSKIQQLHIILTCDELLLDKSVQIASQRQLVTTSCGKESHRLRCQEQENECALSSEDIPLAHLS